MRADWIPAYVGMKVGVGSRFRGNDEGPGGDLETGRVAPRRVARSRSAVGDNTPILRAGSGMG